MKNILDQGIVLYLKANRKRAETIVGRAFKGFGIRKVRKDQGKKRPKSVTGTLQ